MSGWVMFTSDENAQVLGAFAKALTAIEPVAKSESANVGKYSYTYVPLPVVLEECKRAAGLFGLSLSQNPTSVDGQLAITTLLVHESGEWLAFPAAMIKQSAEAQALGSGMTYLRRYALMSIFGLAAEDDDGRAATQAERAPDQYGGYRSGAEQRIHEVIRALPDDHGKLLRAQFREVFGPLSELAVSRHGDALTWVLAWTPPEPQGGDGDEDRQRTADILEQAAGMPVEQA